jgi:CheY-like chemotaxis protein
VEDVEAMSERRQLPSSNLTPADVAGLKVLVVDDHANTVRLIGDVLRAAGVGMVHTASDGMRARGMLYQVQPDIIFTDSKMPYMDGLELTRSIRRAAVESDPRVPNPQVPIVMVTGDCSVRDVHIARLAGVNEFVIKPFTPAALLSRIQLVLKKPRPFIVSEAYVGPDRRRRVELNYSGPLRRTNDPDAIVDTTEREEARETISLELEAMRRLVAARQGVDRPTLQMIYRVMQHTTFRARQVRDLAVERASESLLAYVNAMGGAGDCDPAVIDAHFEAMGQLLAVEGLDEATAAGTADKLERLTASHAARARVAAA